MQGRMRVMLWDSVLIACSGPSYVMRHRRKRGFVRVGKFLLTERIDGEFTLLWKPIAISELSRQICF